MEQSVLEMSLAAYPTHQVCPSSCFYLEGSTLGPSLFLLKVLWEKEQGGVGG